MLFEKKVEILRKEKHKGRETKEFLADVVKIAEGEAFEYVMGEVTFCNARVDLSYRPMIPRKETEFWVEQALHALLGGKEYVAKIESGSFYEVLDLFSGSGCVGLGVLKKLSQSRVTFVELDASLLRQIEISCEKNRFETGRYDVQAGDTFGEVKGLYDAIFAVPPYVPSHMKEEVMSELHAEPSLAFFDKEGGYYFHKKIISGVKKYIKKGGILALEFDITQRIHIEKMIRDEGFFRYSFLCDPYGHECVVVIYFE